MNVVFVIGTLSTGGAEGVVRMLSIFLSKRDNWNVKVVVFNGRGGDLNLDMLRAEGIELIVLSKNFTYSPLHIFSLRRILKNADIVHSHLFPAFYYTILASTGLNIKAIYTEHCTWNRRSNLWFFRILDGFMYSKYSVILAISNEVKSFLVDTYGESVIHRIEEIRNAVDISLFKSSGGISRSDLNLNQDDFIITQISAFRAQKNQLCAIRACQLLPSHFKMLFCGDGEEIIKCKKLVQDLSLTDRVLFLGNIKEIPSILSISDISLLSTFYEGLPLAILESFAAKKLVIASNVPGVTEILSGRGVLFESNNHEILAKVLLHVEENINDYMGLVNLAYEFVEENSLDKFITDHSNLYSTMVPN